jgi:hypothetical protein
MLLTLYIYVAVMCVRHDLSPFQGMHLDSVVESEIMVFVGGKLCSTVSNDEVYGYVKVAFQQ